MSSVAMSTWKCSNCDLYNYLSSNQCTACFNFTNSEDHTEINVMEEQVLLNDTIHLPRNPILAKVLKHEEELTILDQKNNEDSTHQPVSNNMLIQPHIDGKKIHQTTTDIMNVIAKQKYTTTKWQDFIISGFLRTIPSFTSIDQIPSDMNLLIAMFLYFEMDNNHDYESTDNKDIWCSSPTTISKIFPCHTSFRKRCEYWNKDDPKYVKPKYKNLKQEVIKGPFQISKDNWNQTLRKSKIFYQSNISQKFIAKSNKWNKICNIAAGTKMTLQHVVVIKLFTDFDRSQERWHEIIQGNDFEKKAEIAHFTEMFIAAINLYGDDKNSSGSKKYFGVPSSFMALDTVNPTFYYPITVTASYHVARTFATKDGYIVCMEEGADCNPVYFDLAQLSDYPEEQSCLIYGGIFNVNKVSVREPKESTGDLTNMRLIEQIMMGLVLKDDSLWNDECKDEFNVLLNNYLSLKSMNETCGITAKQKIFNNIMDKMDTICLNERYFRDGFKSFIKIFGNNHHESIAIFLKYNNKFESLVIMDQVLFNGYIRNFEKYQGIFIPTEVKSLCCEYLNDETIHWYPNEDNYPECNKIRLIRFGGVKPGSLVLRSKLNLKDSRITSNKCRDRKEVKVKDMNLAST